MSGLKIAAILLIVAGTLGLAYGGFRYTQATHHATIGPMEMTVTEHRTVNIPIWAGVGAIVVGTVLLLTSKKSTA